MVAMNAEYWQTNIEVRIFVVHMTKSGPKKRQKKKEERNAKIRMGEKLGNKTSTLQLEKLEIEIEENKRQHKTVTLKLTRTQFL